MERENLIYYKEEEEPAQEIKKMYKVNKIQPTNSNAVYRVSPVVVYGKGHIVIPKVKIGSNPMASGNITQSVGENYIKEDKLDKPDGLKDKFLVTSSNMAAEDKTNIKDDNLDSDESEGKIEIKKGDEDRKNCDMFNLYRGFQYAFDPFHMRSSDLDNEEDNSPELNFESVNSKIESLFGISI